MAVVKKPGQSGTLRGKSLWLVQLTPEVGVDGKADIKVEITDDGPQTGSQTAVIAIGPSRERRYEAVGDQVPIIINDFTTEPAKATPYGSTIKTTDLVGGIADGAKSTA